MQTTHPLIVKNLTKKYGDFTALDNISFTVNRGEVFGYLGPNGAGKTTTIRLLAGLSRASAGVCRILGQSTECIKDMYNKIGILFEEKNLYERLTGLQNLKFYAHLYSVNEKRIITLLERFDLIGAEQKKVSTYSKGMKQRLLICRTLLHNPELLILDEPTDGLDPNSADVIILAIKDFVKSGKTVFLSSHNMDEVDEVCNRVAFLKKGKITNINSPDVLKKQYGQPVLQVKIQGRVKERLEDIISPEEDVIEHSSNIFQLNLYLNRNNPWQRLDKLRKIKGCRILSVHSREASLKEVFKKITS